MGFQISDEQVQQFHRDGYVLVKGLFDAEETQMLREAARNDETIRSNSFDVEDTAGKMSKMALWNHPSDDVFGMVARGHRLVDTAERLLDDEVYHYHTKLSMKEPKVGGAWEWHQDYGYWYQNGCLFPDMISCMIALDAATRENGCMQVLRESHRMGRIDHGIEGDQMGADKERVAEAEKVLDLEFAEMDPGDTLFFHGNTLHHSAANESNKRRWVLICCYNAKSNNPYKEHHHPQYTPLEKVSDSAVKEAGNSPLDAKRTYMNVREDQTTASGKD